MKINIILFALTLLLVAMLPALVYYYILKPNTTKIEIGKHYATSFHWQEENPFKPTKIDTVKVIDIKDGYVLWEYKEGFTQSSKLKVFKLLLKPE